MDNIIVYRSSFDRDADLFWQQNPELILYFFGFIFLAMVCHWIFNRKK